MLKLYKPDKYKLLTGKKENIGFCTVWNEPKRVFDKIEDKVALVGTLYSKYGINILFRNLALNPQINTLYIWANGPLSNTEVGKGGFANLKKLWEDKSFVDEFDFEEGIKVDIVKKIISNVSLKDISDKTIDEVKDLISKNNSKTNPYMKPAKFKEPKRLDFATFPSEGVGFLIKERKLGEVWIKIVDTIMRYGLTTGTQVGYKQKQIFGLGWVIEDEDVDNLDLSVVEDLPKSLKETAGISIKSLDQYYKEVFEKSEENKNLAYTYGNRLQRYKINEKKEFDQVKNTMIEQIKKSPTTRRAATTLIYPLKDYEHSDPPCLSLVQVLTDEDKLHMFAVFRSQDMFKSTFSNTYGLLKLQQYICNETGFKRGKMHITSQSAHIYEQDWKGAENLVRCKVREKEPVMFWDHTKHSDPRGNFLVSVHGEKIEVTLQSLTGETLFSITGKTSKYLSLKITQMGLISKVDHAMDIARELQKAEIALQKGIDYNQDQPLSL